MNILGIETSCDETGAAIVVNGRQILSNVIASSLKEHSRYGGVIPEIASRHQLECIHAVVKSCLHKSNLSLNKIDAVAVTNFPGLIGSLLVGKSFAQALSYSLNKPFIKINHIHAHIYANFLIDQKNKKFKEPVLPAIGLVVSGGHTNLYYIHSKTSYKLIGTTRDDAAGEAFDKTAKILGLKYPGGPEIDRLASKSKNSQIRFTCAALPDTLDFSFSGIKTAVLYYKRDNKTSHNADIANAFQQSVVNILIKKALLACKKYKLKTLLIGGGVASNSLFRKKLQELNLIHKIDTYYPNINLCIDNAAMIAGLAYPLIKKGVSIGYNS